MDEISYPTFLLILVAGALVWVALIGIYEKIKSNGFEEGKVAKEKMLKNEMELFEREKSEHCKEKERWQRQKQSEEIELVQKKSAIERKRKMMLEEIAKEVDYAHRVDERIAQGKDAIQKAAQDVLIAAPYAADLVADCIEAHDLMMSDFLATKAHPALKAAEVVREYAKEKKNIEKDLLLYKYKLAVFEEYFPWIGEDEELSVAELCKVNKNEEEGDSKDPVAFYVTPTEYTELTKTQRDQLALDRYIASHKKTTWEIGRDYELFIGYLFERDGYRVEYTGSIFRFDDLGRDLVVSKGTTVHIVQCKYWSKEKEIHEKHIFQLFGTSICYQIDHPNKKVSCVLVTNTTCSDTARAFACKMGVKLRENIELDEFPRIKCNISSEGERIYHLPMDQQYDNVRIDKQGEFFAKTVQEAVDKGFRRAYRWHGGI